MRKSVAYGCRTMAVLGALATATMIGCGSSDGGSEADLDPSILARYEGGQVTADDLRERILGLAPEARQPHDGDFEAWYLAHIRELTLERLAHAEAEVAGTADRPAYQERSQRVRRQIISGHYAEQHLPPVEPVSEAELRARYAQDLDRYRMPPRRQVFQIFKRFGDRDPAVVQAEIETIRERVVNGERFQILATAHSDSESRHTEGELGWFEPGQLARDLEGVVFALDERVPSQPIRTADGVHLFWVENAFPGQQFSFEEARASITNRMQWERRQEALDALAGEPPAGSYVPTRAELETLTSGRDPRALVLRIGTFSLTAGGFNGMVREARQQDSTQNLTDFAWRLLASIRQRELLFRQAEAAGFEPTGALAKLLERLEGQAMVQVYLQDELAARVRRDEEALRAYHDLHQRRFNEPLRLRLSWLIVPLSDQANDHVARLETARAALDAGDTDLDTLATTLGGRVDGADWQTLPQIHQRVEKAAELAVDLRAGEHSPPFRFRDALYVVRVDERRDPEPKTFESALDDVVTDYLEHHGTEVLAAYQEDLLDGVGYRSFPAHLANFQAAAAGTSTEAAKRNVTPGDRP